MHFCSCLKQWPMGQCFDLNFFFDDLSISESTWCRIACDTSWNINSIEIEWSNFTSRKMSYSKTWNFTDFFRVWAKFEKYNYDTSLFIQFCFGFTQGITIVFLLLKALLCLWPGISLYMNIFSLCRPKTSSFT
jgi:hypothetical protein